MFQEIESAFSKLKLRLKRDVAQLEAYQMPDSGMNNRYLVAETIDSQKYLIRINGKLWLPFTRTQEEYNVRQLKRHGIQTQVMINDVKNGFQICKLAPEINRFNVVAPREQKTNMLTSVAHLMRQLHRVTYVNNTYLIAPTILHSFQHLPPEISKILSFALEIILRMLSRIHQDKENFVTSHNDLLPSNVYIEQEKVCFVDWEYSGMNHRSYDLVFFSKKASLNLTEEKLLTKKYDPRNQFEMHKSMILMKPIVSFLLLLWCLPKKCIKKDPEPNALLLGLMDDICNALVYQSLKSLTAGIRLSCFGQQTQFKIELGINSDSSSCAQPEAERLNTIELR